MSDYTTYNLLQKHDYKQQQQYIHDTKLLLELPVLGAARIISPHDDNVDGVASESHSKVITAMAKGILFS